MTAYKIDHFPKSRIATNDICTIGLQKHHVAAMMEMDVTDGREEIHRQKQNGNDISLTAWLIKEMADTIKDHPRVAGYLRGKREVLIFKDVNVSLLVEKEVDGQKVPIPLVVEMANDRTISSIAEQIEAAKNRKMTASDIVLHRKANRMERLYHILPGWARRGFWRFLLRRPNLAYSKMGNVGFTTVGMMGNVNGWFVPISIHPICFGVGSIIPKPVVVEDKIEIREILNMTILLDHDVVDGGEMARFVADLSKNISSAKALHNT